MGERGNGSSSKTTKKSRAEIILSSNSIGKLTTKRNLERRLNMYAETVIKPANSGFGMWEVGEYSEDLWENEDALIDAMAENLIEIFELGVDELPEGFEDIRGRINNEPDRVFGYRAFWQDIGYAGVSKI
jgi:hypothetical protein